MFRRLSFALIAASCFVIAGCGGKSLSANSTCQQFLNASPEAADHAVLSLAGRFHAPDATTPLGRPNVNYQCANDPSKTLGQVLQSMSTRAPNTPEARTTTSSALQKAFRFGGGGSTPSLTDLKERVDTNPRDSQAWRELASGYEQEGNATSAVTALLHYLKLQPRDTSALQELASQYTTLADTFTREGKSGPLLHTARAEEQTYEKLSRLTPTDASVQIELGQAAQAAHDPSTARAAYQAFLRLAPNDPLAPQVRNVLASLQ